MPIDFNVRPRHVEMFGAQGILRPLYQRQAQKFALTEQQRQEQSQFEQMKALAQLRANLRRPVEEAQIEAQKAQTAYYRTRQEASEFELGRVQSDAEATDSFAREYAVAPPEKRPEIIRRELARQGALQNLLPQQQKPGRQESTLVPQYNEQGMFTGFEEVSGMVHFPPVGYTKLGVGGGVAQKPLKPADVEEDIRANLKLLPTRDLSKPVRRVLANLGASKRGRKGTVDEFVSGFFSHPWDKSENDIFTAIENEIRAGNDDLQLKTIYSYLYPLSQHWGAAAYIGGGQGGGAQSGADIGLQQFGEDAMQGGQGGGGVQTMQTISEAEVERTLEERQETVEQWEERTGEKMSERDKKLFNRRRRDRIESQKQQFLKRSKEEERRKQEAALKEIQKLHRTYLKPEPSMLQYKF